jgi:hypothetical protein
MQNVSLRVVLIVSDLYGAKLTKAYLQTSRVEISSSMAVWLNILSMEHMLQNTKRSFHAAHVVVFVFVKSCSTHIF